MQPQRTYQINRSNKVLALLPYWNISAILLTVALEYSLIIIYSFEQFPLVNSFELKNNYSGNPKEAIKILYEILSNRINKLTQRVLYFLIFDWFSNSTQRGFNLAAQAYVSY
jgi:hypothetical protein